jgi:hypothetical protein
MTWEMAFAIFGTMIALFGAFSGLMLWMMSRMETRLHNDITAIITDSNLKWVAFNARTDAVNARVDTTQGILMRMLEEQKK